jgi:hypothetical protein
MKLRLAVLVATVCALFGFAMPSLAKDCGAQCETCYCTFKNGSMCDADHGILGTCTCRCAKRKKVANLTDVKKEPKKEVKKEADKK